MKKGLKATKLKHNEHKHTHAHTSQLIYLPGQITLAISIKQAHTHQTHGTHRHTGMINPNPIIQFGLMVRERTGKRKPRQIISSLLIIYPIIIIIIFIINIIKNHRHYDYFHFSLSFNIIHHFGSIINNELIIIIRAV